MTIAARMAGARPRRRSYQTVNGQVVEPYFNRKPVTPTPDNTPGGGLHSRADWDAMFPRNPDGSPRASAPETSGAAAENPDNAPGGGLTAQADWNDRFPGARRPQAPPASGGVGPGGARSAPGSPAGPAAPAAKPGSAAPAQIARPQSGSISPPPFRASTLQEIEEFGGGLDPDKAAESRAVLPKIAAAAGRNVTVETPYGPVSSGVPVQGPNRFGRAGAPTWQQQITNKYPEIAQAGSPANKAFADAYNIAIQRQGPNPDGSSRAQFDPVRLADEVMNPKGAGTTGTPRVAGSLNVSAPGSNTGNSAPAAQTQPSTDEGEDDSLAHKAGVAAHNLPQNIDDTFSAGREAVVNGAADFYAGLTGNDPKRTRQQWTKKVKEVIGMPPDFPPADQPGGRPGGTGGVTSPTSNQRPRVGADPDASPTDASSNQVGVRPSGGGGLNPGSDPANPAVESVNGSKAGVGSRIAGDKSWDNSDSGVKNGANPQPGAPMLSTATADASDQDTAIFKPKPSDWPPSDGGMIASAAAPANVPGDEDDEFRKIRQTYSGAAGQSMQSPLRQEDAYA